MLLLIYWLKSLNHEVLLVQRVFTNKDGSTGLLNRVYSDLAGDDGQALILYQKLEGRAVS